MANPRPFAGQLKYAMLALLIVVTVGYGYYLFKIYGPEPEKYTVAVAVMVDGTVRIDGALFESPSKLTPKVAQIQRDHPNAGFSIRAPHGETMMAVAKAVVLLQKSGAKTVWVLNDPKSAAP